MEGAIGHIVVPGDMVALDEPIREAPPRLTARLAGVFYLLTFLIGGVAEFAISRLEVSDNAKATAANILAHQPLFWMGFAAYLLVIICYIVVTALFYEIFRSVNRTLSLLAAFFSLVGCAIQASSCFFYLAPWVLLNNGDLNAFRADQVQDLAYVFLKIYGQSYSIGFVFFGFYCFLIGILIWKSTFLPRILGVLMMSAGAGWLIFLIPPAANALWPYVALPGVIGEASLTLWLITRGVKVSGGGNR